MIRDVIDFYTLYIFGFGWWFSGWFLETFDEYLGTAGAVSLFIVLFPVWTVLAVAGLLSILPVGLLFIAGSIISAPIVIPVSIWKKHKKSSK